MIGGKFRDRDHVVRTKWKQVVEKVTNDGWSDWRELEEEHRICCCECGLVHDIQFSRLDGGLAARARINRRATAQMRRKRRLAT